MYTYDMYTYICIYIYNYLYTYIYIRGGEGGIRREKV
jgi:hypothetical protein